MTANIFTDALFWFFAIVGIFNIISDITSFFLAQVKKSGTLTDRCVVVTVKNQQETVEGLIRSVVWQQLHRKNGGCIPNIVVVDLGSTDDTPEILKKIAGDYSFVQITDKDGYIELIKSMT